MAAEEAPMQVQVLSFRRGGRSYSLFITSQKGIKGGKAVRCKESVR